MPKPPFWEAPFLKALAATGIASAAAEVAGITVRNAFKRKKANSTFASAWEAAVDLHRAERARQALATLAIEDASFRQVAGGARMEFPGSGPRADFPGKPASSRWSKRGEAAFLAALAATANVRKACAAAGFSPQALYKKRLTSRRFAEAWDAALAIGRARVEAYLIEAADRTFDPASIADDADIPKMTIAEAIRIAQLGRAQAGRTAAGAGGATSGRGWIGPESWDQPPQGEDEMAEIRARILGRLERIRAQDEEEKLAAGWTRVAVPGCDDDAPEHDRWTWLPPGLAPLVEVKALPAADEATEQGEPRVRGL